MRVVTHDSKATKFSHSELYVHRVNFLLALYKYDLFLQRFCDQAIF